MTPTACAAVAEWINDFVVAHNLCPFAAKELLAERVRIVETQAADEAALLLALHDECALLMSNPDIETTVLVHPHVLQDFTDYNEFLGLADALLGSLDLEGELQVASFHPDYCFADTAADAPDNLTNRSPFPMLHLLREESVERAVASHPDVASIPERNIALLRSLSEAQR
jgi:hypothetical protein